MASGLCSARRTWAHDVFAQMNLPAFENRWHCREAVRFRPRQWGTLPHLRQDLGIVEDALCIAAIGAANQEENVRLQAALSSASSSVSWKGVGFEGPWLRPQAGLPGGLAVSSGTRPEASSGALGGGGAGVPVGKGQRTGLASSRARALARPSVTSVSTVV